MPERRILLAGLGLALATVACFAGVLENDFVNYDDDLYVTDRPEIAAGLTGDTVAWAFTSFQGANWFPLTRLSWLLDAQLFGVEAAAFHATSLALHVLNALLLLLALARLTGSPWPSLFVAGVFALHPLHVESVAWVSARKDLVAGLFFMLALLAHERVARSARPWAWGFALFACLGLGLMAKPMLVTLPCVLLLLDVWPLGRVLRAGGGLDAGGLARAVLEKLPLFALVAAASAVTLFAQDAGGALQSGDRYPLWVRAANFCEAVAMYVSQAFWPRGMAVFYPHPFGTLSPWRVGVGAALLLGLSLWLLRRMGRLPAVAVGWLWFVGMLVPVSGLLQVGQASRADRYTYLPLIGLAIAFAWGVRGLAARWPALRAPVGGGALVALLLLGVLSAAQVEVWRSSRTLFEHALEVTEHNHVAHINLGLALHRAGRSADAAPHLSRAIAISPASAHARGIRGEARLALERADTAETDFRAALRIEPDSARWAVGLGRALIALERWDEAEDALARALALEAGAPDIHALLGQAQARAGRAGVAEQSFRRAVADEALLEARLGRAGVALAHGQLGALLAARGELDAALRRFDRAIELAPGKAEYHSSRGLVLQTQGREAEAVASYRRALELGEDSARLLNNMAWILAVSSDARLREPSEAVSLAARAAERSGNRDPKILDTLATAYRAAGREADALSTARRALELAEAQGRRGLAASIRERFPALSGGGEGDEVEAGA